MLTTTVEKIQSEREQRIQHRVIKKVAVLGAGIMGSRIAMHFANIGVPVILLDIAPNELTSEEVAAGLTLDSPQVRNRIVNKLFNEALKSSPSPIYEESLTNLIELGNFTDDLSKISSCDWILEAVVERLDIKQSLFAEVEKYRKPGTLVTSNTSGIPIRMMTQGRSDDFNRHFCGTHFFNPPRYLALLEIIPTSYTDPEVVRFLMYYGDRFLGKKTVLAKDTPAFIANRVGIYAIMDLLHLVKKYGLTVEEVDALTGPVIGNPRSATFRTLDVVGLDTAVKVAKGLYDNCPQDERRELFNLPDYIQKMVDMQMWGDKTAQGFYKKVKSQTGKSEIYALDFNTFEYRPQAKVKIPILEQLKPLENLEDRIKTLAQGTDKYSEFMREATYGLLAYVSFRIPEIADELYKIDNALKAGFGWAMGPFEKWDVLGVAPTVEAMEKAGFGVAPWVKDMLAAGFSSFYTVQNGVRLYYDIPTKSYQEIPGTRDFIILDNLRAQKTLWQNNGCAIIDLGDGVLNVEFRTKMNTVGGEVIEGIHRAIDMAEKSYNGVVIGNQGENFSAGANLALILNLAIEQEFDELEYAVRMFQNVVMRVRYSGVPVVVAPHGLTLGGGCELTMHADIAQAAAETYIGLVEVGVGLIPAGGGTKELVLRMSDEYMKGDVEINALEHYLKIIATAKVATSALEAYKYNILRKGRDRVTINKDRLLSDAKSAVLELAEAGYVQPVPRKDIRVLGRTGLGAVHAFAYSMVYAGYATEYDRFIAEKVGYVMCGGDLSTPTLVSEQYLLDLEREVFLSLLGQKKTLERIQHMLQTGKPLRN
ncbi:MAG: 3-hydroxyacyl-CoA dehydrogenase NAD-binding domain-containing protein [Bacteroidia bacterium]|nr:3-hydroxyacyl-CoA dehydrogenase NAD-binding domain-containing protein [Bacteroidia bacterium]MDW8158003.1 3-hydroxyacyl-CoA dehydrogenase NAD-binding domain-containing protein [Bacteroidia bacterium]